MKATIHFHQVICSKTGSVCGHENQFCDECLFKNPPTYTTISSDTWQRCPICNGSGTVYNTLSSNGFTACTVCNGKKIISTINGLPPTP